jgi:hypothetical protein
VRGYATLLKLTAPVIRERDPNATIVLGGMNGDGGRAKHAITAWKYLGKLYGRPGIKSLFDAAAIHPYDKTASGAVDEVRHLRSVMTAHHDGGAALWVTEIGWSSDGGNSTVSAGPIGQAKRLRDAFSALLTHQSTWNLQRVFWYSWRDLDDAVCAWCGSSGLLSTGLVPKLAWTTYQHFTIGIPLSSLLG